MWSWSCNGGLKIGFKVLLASSPKQSFPLCINILELHARRPRAFLSYISLFALHSVCFHSLNRSYPHSKSLISILMTLASFWTKEGPPQRSSPPPQSQMPPPPHTKPLLTPSFCLTPNALSAFLRLSRSAIDDPVSQHLSALSTPSRPAFTESSPTRKSSTHLLPANSCARFLRESLIPAWAARDAALNYCELIAEQGADEERLKKLRLEEENRERNKWKEEQDGLDELTRRVEVEQRLDPYSNRPGWEDVDSPTEALARTVQAERTVERIVRSRTWETFGARCEGGAKGWALIKESMNGRGPHGD